MIIRKFIALIITFLLFSCSKYNSNVDSIDDPKVVINVNKYVADAIVSDTFSVAEDEEITIKIDCGQYEKEVGGHNYGMINELSCYDKINNICFLLLKEEDTVFEYNKIPITKSNLNYNIWMDFPVDNTYVIQSVGPPDNPDRNIWFAHSGARSSDVIKLAGKTSKKCEEVVANFINYPSL